jgi:hypothetical protein
MFFPRRSNLRNFLHYSAWPTGPERNNPKQNGAGLSRSGVRAGIFPQKIQEERSCASSFLARACPARRGFALALRKITGRNGNQCCCSCSQANCSSSERRRRRWKCCSNCRRVGRPTSPLFAAPPLARSSNYRAVRQLCVKRDG